MAGFVTKGDVELTINGVDFELDSTDIDLIERLDKFSKEAPILMDELKDREDVVKAVKEATQYAIDTIDNFLGEGASKKIWKDETVSIFKAVSVINYINDEIAKSRKKGLDKFNPNRAQRRAK